MKIEPSNIFCVVDGTPNYENKYIKEDEEFKEPYFLKFKKELLKYHFESYCCPLDICIGAANKFLIPIMDSRGHIVKYPVIMHIDNSYKHKDWNIFINYFCSILYKNYTAVYGYDLSKIKELKIPRIFLYKRSEKNDESLGERDFKFLIYGFISYEYINIRSTSLDKALKKVFGKLEKSGENCYYLDNGVMIEVDDRGMKLNSYVIKIKYIENNMNVYSISEYNYNLILRDRLEYKKFKIEGIEKFTENFPVNPVIDFMEQNLLNGDVTCMNVINGVRTFYLNLKESYHVFVKDGILFIV